MLANVSRSVSFFTSRIHLYVAQRVAKSLSLRLYYRVLAFLPNVGQRISEFVEKCLGFVFLVRANVSSNGLRFF